MCNELADKKKGHEVIRDEYEDYRKKWYRKAAVLQLNAWKDTAGFFATGTISCTGIRMWLCMLPAWIPGIYADAGKRVGCRRDWINLWKSFNKDYIGEL